MDPKIGKKNEDEYFARQEYERQRKLAQQREAQLEQDQRDQLKQTHWMRCPKDGMELVEIEFMGVKVDKCTHCGGIFLDAGELDQLFAVNSKQSGVIIKVLQVFR
ncbi:MAG: zf-TFIIB domain-containing protein [Candidatus Alcyoniella australis]|nr:zf-TFIIB domain-containing protein [Candidatus Alcyoniella australis]